MLSWRMLRPTLIPIGGRARLSDQCASLSSLTPVARNQIVTADSISTTTLKKLAQYDTPTICNVIELFEYRANTAGYMDGRIRAAFPEMPPMVGFATTATFRSATRPKSD